jgi:hypothetical protein
LVPIVIRIKVDKCFSLATIRLFGETTKQIAKNYVGLLLESGKVEGRQ